MLGRRKDRGRGGAWIDGSHLRPLGCERHGSMQQVGFWFHPSKA